MIRIAVIVFAALSLAACKDRVEAPEPQAAAASAPIDQPEQVPPPASAADVFAAKLDTVLKGAWRSEAHVARDQYRHPRETLAFFGVEPNMTVIEITPGGGWYTEVLAPWIKGSGHYIGAVQEPREDAEGEPGEARLRARFAAEPTVFGEADVVVFDPKAPVFGAPGSADRVLTFRNVHNWVGGGYAPAMFEGFFQVLKPGGVLGLTDHRASEGATMEQVAGGGYLPVDYVIQLATDAGFQLEEQSEINANPKDSHEHPSGVWTLPPTLALGDKDKAKYLAIGESDRMTLRFVKPMPDVISTVGMDKKPAASASAGN